MAGTGSPDVVYCKLSHAMIIQSIDIKQKVTVASPVSPHQPRRPPSRHKMRYDLGYQRSRQSGSCTTTQALFSLVH